MADDQRARLVHRPPQFRGEPATADVRLAEARRAGAAVVPRPPAVEKARDAPRAPQVDRLVRQERVVALRRWLDDDRRHLTGWCRGRDSSRSVEPSPSAIALERGPVQAMRLVRIP
jgi:hypothetical protein